MKEQLEKDRRRMSDAERRFVWEAVRGGRRRRGRNWGSWRVWSPVMVGAAAVVVMTVVMRDRVPDGLMFDSAVTEETVLSPASVSESKEMADQDLSPKQTGQFRSLGYTASRDDRSETPLSATPSPAPPSGSGREARGYVLLEESDPVAEIAETPSSEQKRDVDTVTSDRLVAAADMEAAEGQVAEDVSGGRAERARIAEAESEAPPSVRAKSLSSDFGEIRGTVTDGNGNPLAFASVVILGTQWGAMSLEDGTFSIRNVPEGMYDLRVVMMGYEQQDIDSVLVMNGKVPDLAFAIDDRPVGTLGEVAIVSEKTRIPRRGTGLAQDVDAAAPEVGAAWTPSKNSPGEPKDVRLRPAEFKKAEGETFVNDNAADGARLAHGGDTPPNDEPYDAMFFQNYGANPLILADMDRYSTFAVDVDNAAYTLARRYIQGGNLPDRDAPRVEEFVNFFDGGYPQLEDETFQIHMDGAPSEFGPGFQLMRVGIKGKTIADHDRKRANLVFVVDISGSMNRENRLGLVKRSLRILVDNLRPNDTVGIVVYGSNGRVVLEPSTLATSWQIHEAIDQLQTNGGTNAEEGLTLGYDMVRRYFDPDATNRIILCSDGVANVGRTGPESILERVRVEADRGVYLTTVGFGMGNYNDVLMEQLANNGDGSYYYVDDLGEAKRVFVENLTGTLQVIARDAKIQVEFDPETVLAYRLIGFENRDVADEDFRNDEIDAGEIGAGHEVVALYELRFRDEVRPGRSDADFATVRFRYEEPGSARGERGEVREIAATMNVREFAGEFEDASDRFQLAAAVAEFAEILRHSYWAKGSEIEGLVPLANDLAIRMREDPRVVEFAELVRRASSLNAKLPPEAMEAKIRWIRNQKPTPPHFPQVNESGIDFGESAPTRNEED